MKLVIKKEDLVFAAQAVHPLVNTQSSLPILSNILIKAVDSSVLFVASDMESSVRCTVSAEFDKPFSLTVPSATFANLVKELPDSDVTLELVDDQVQVSCENLNYKLATRDPIDFPSWPEFEEDASIEVQQKDLRHAVECVIFAIPIRDPRKVLLGCRWSNC